MLDKNSRLKEEVEKELSEKGLSQKNIDAEFEKIEKSFNKIKEN